MTLEQLLAALSALLEKAQAESRPLTDEEAAQASQLEEDIKRFETTEALKTRQAARTEVRNRSEVPEVRHADVPAEAQERAFNAYLRTGKDNDELTEYRAQSAGTNSAGGYTVPETLRQKLVDRRKAFGGVGPDAEQLTTSSGELMTWPTLDDTGNSGVIAAEGTAPASGGADLVFGEKTLGAFEYVAPGASNLPLRVSNVLLQDSAFDVEALVKNKLSIRIYRKQAVDFVNGTGTGEPEGVATSTTVTATFTAAAPTYAELVAAKHTVDPEYRDSGSCKWYFNDATFALIEQVVDGNGRPLLFQSTDSITGKAVYQLLGYPVVIDQAFATYVDGGTNKWGVFGDLKEGYVVRHVKDITVIVNPYSRANERQVEFTMWARADGRIQNPYAFSVLKNAA